MSEIHNPQPRPEPDPEANMAAEFQQRLFVDRDAGLLAWVIQNPWKSGELWSAYCRKALSLRGNALRPH